MALSFVTLTKTHFYFLYIWDHTKSNTQKKTYLASLLMPKRNQRTSSYEYDRYGSYRILYQSWQFPHRNLSDENLIRGITSHVRFNTHLFLLMSIIYVSELEHIHFVQKVRMNKIMRCYRLKRTFNLFHLAVHNSNIVV